MNLTNGFLSPRCLLPSRLTPHASRVSPSGPPVSFAPTCIRCYEFGSPVDFVPLVVLVDRTNETNQINQTNHGFSLLLPFLAHDPPRSLRSRPDQRQNVPLSFTRVSPLGLLLAFTGVRAIFKGISHSLVSGIQLSLPVSSDTFSHVLVMVRSESQKGFDKENSQE
jgi:hypothetical protein